MDSIKDNQHSSGNQYVVRAATKNDAIKVAELAQALAAHERLKSDFHAASFLRDCVENDFCKIMVAEYDGEIVGFIMFYPGYDLTSASRGLHLGDIFVAEAHRKKGVGRELFSAAAEWGRKNISAEWMSWTALKDNSSALKFYESLGAITRHDIAFQAVGIDN